MNKKRIIKSHLSQELEKRCTQLGLIEGSVFYDLYSTPHHDYSMILVEKKIFGVPFWIMKQWVCES